jgi:hypothetical protein
MRRREFIILLGGAAVVGGNFVLYSAAKSRSLSSLPTRAFSSAAASLMRTAIFSATSEPWTAEAALPAGVCSNSFRPVGFSQCLCQLAAIAAVTLLLCTAGNVVLAQEGQATTATASANNRGDACAQSIENVINLCMMRGLNNIGPVKCDCVQDGPKWTCTGVASCVK